MDLLRGHTMNLNTFNINHHTDETRNKISETMKRTGELWRRYLELLPDEYHFDTCKQFRTYLKRTNDTHLIKLLGGQK